MSCRTTLMHCCHLVFLIQCTGLNKVLWTGGPPKPDQSMQLDQGLNPQPAAPFSNHQACTTPSLRVEECWACHSGRVTVGVSQRECHRGRVTEGMSQRACHSGRGSAPHFHSEKHGAIASHHNYMFMGIL
ncbi:hypothetical protein EYF80_013860 [Liparis tanakae]|uniref:Secreted protein n=1 Tax=Liparis tanakae TaxID=230148 RepID=A0A4Z2ID58_9TELE|nr:hypothetical protein EYF80_013860 [Liparis tanakae]